MGIPFSNSWVQSILRALLSPDDQELVDLSKDITGTIVLELERREWRVLAGERYFAAVNTQAGVAAQLSAVGLVLPTDSGMLSACFFVKNTAAVVVDLILGALGVQTLVPGEIARAPAVAPLDTEGIKQVAGGGTVLSSATQVFRAASVAGVGAGIYTLHESLAAGERLTKEQHGYLVIMRGGGFLALQTQALNTAISGNLFFYERPVEKGRFFK